MKKIRVLIADDHTIVRQGLRALLEAADDIDVIGEASDGRAAVELAGKVLPDVLILDIAMPGLNGIEATRQMTKRYPQVRVIVLTVHSAEEYILQALRAGAVGYVVKQAAVEELILGVRAVFRGESFLSPSISKKVVDEYIRRAEGAVEPTPVDRLTDREREVLQLLAEGQSVREIAVALQISPKTVETHRAHILEKLEARNTAELVQIALRAGLIAAEF
jgi:DNA-binding NarL/FixJ family response regulator